MKNINKKIIDIMVQFLMCCDEMLYYEKDIDIVRLLTLYYMNELMIEEIKSKRIDYQQVLEKIEYKLLRQKERMLNESKNN